MINQHIQMDIQTQKNEDRKGAKTRVRVAIRVRPMIPKEIANNQNSCVQFNGGQQIILAKERNYKFDYVFRDNTPQSQVYQSCVKELVLGCFQGYNAAILAYGQTGSGKTFTMGTAISTLDSNSHQGIIPRVIQQIFTQIKERQKKAQFIIKASFLQIYNQQILDLLTDSVSNKNKNKQQMITIRQQKDGSVSICNVTQQQVTSAEQMMELLQRGGYHRTTATTLMNDASSRSHAIFTIFIEQHRIDDLYQKDPKTKDVGSDIDQGFMTAKFFFVDLAGSQRAKKTGATGVTLKQGININLGLLELGNVISALADIEQKQDKFITYRNSKLTRILQQCLGGNSNTYMIACVSPAESNFQQSLNTLKYASKAMNIKNKPIKNVDPHTAQVSQLKQRIYELQVQNRKLKALLNQKGVNVQEQMGHSADIMNQQRQKLKKMYTILQKKYEEAINQLKQQKKEKNKLQMNQYQLKRQRDLVMLKLEIFKQKYPAEYIKFSEVNHELEVGPQKLTVLNELSERIQLLANQLKDKDKINSQLQKQFEKLQQNSKKDQKLLIAKNTTIHQLKRQNQRLQKMISKLKASIQGYKLQPMNELNITNLSASQNKGEDNDGQFGQNVDQNYQIDQSYMQFPSQLLQNQKDFRQMTYKTQEQLSSVDRKILQHERDLQSMNSNQIKLEYQLISEMKEEYHQKIVLLQKQKTNLMKMRDQSVGVNEKNKFINKIDNLENQLKDYRKKAKEQKNLQKLVSNQSNKIKDLANQIKKFKVQKIQLGRKLKQDKDSFQKFKTKKIKQLFQAKKQNVKKDEKIKKMALENARQSQTFKKKEQQLFRAKRINQTLKNLIKPISSVITNPVNNKKSELQSAHTRNQSMQLPQHFDANKSVLTGSYIAGEKFCQQHILRCIKKILGQIDQQKVIKKYQNKVKELKDQIQNLLSQQSANKLKLQKIHMKQESQETPLSQEQQFTKRQLELNVNDLKQRIANAQDSMSFCQAKYQQILQSNRQQIFDIDTQIIYQKGYEQIQSLRVFIRVLFTVLRNILADNYQLNQIKDNLELDISTAHQLNAQLKQKIQVMQADHQQSLEQLRQQMMTRYYSNIEEQQATTINTSHMKRLQERDRKNYQRKIIDLTKTNRQISHQVQMLRRKCNVVQQKYQNIRSLLSKDKGIGRPLNKDIDQVSNKDKKNKKDMMDQINQISNQLDSLKIQKLKRVPSMGGNIGNTGGFEENRYSGQFEKKEEQGQFQYPINKWQCMGKIDAHNSAVLSIATHANMLISTSTKSLKIWDLQTSKIISDLSGAHLTGLVKFVLVQPQRNIMLTACQKVVTVWDLVTLNVQCTLKAHKDQVRTMHIANDILFTGGKGLANSGSLLIWDLRCLDPNKPQQQKQRNQDIFTFASKNNILYYGTRNHHVRRMDMNSMEILSPFEPPHMDTVTGLAIVGDKMISGSKDKNLRLWSLDHSIGNLKNTVHAFNDYVTTVHSQNANTVVQQQNPLPLFYAGSKDGQIKVGSVKGDKIDFLGNILAHTQSVNAVSILQDNNTLVSASADKTIKLWKPTSETIQNINKQFS